VLPYELDGRQHPVFRMLSLWVIEHLDVVEYVLPGFGSGFIGPAPYPFALEQVLAHDGLLASNLRKKVSTNLGAIQLRNRARVNLKNSISNRRHF
jgi:hypothetical protein